MASVISSTTTALSGVASLSTLANSIGNLVLATPSTTQGYQPQNQNSSSGFLSSLLTPKSLLFHYEGENTVTLQSDITDHYVEANSAVQDQISLKPVKITVQGFIGELNDVPPPVLQSLQSASNGLANIGLYAPQLTQSALISYDQAFAAYQLANSLATSAVSAWSTISGSGGESVINGQTITSQSNQNQQQTYFQQFFGYWTQRTLFTVQTPWAIFQNMAIESFRAIQDAETRMISDFEITFKVIQTAQTSVSAGIGSLVALNKQGQAASLANLGISSPLSSTSLGTGLSGMGAF